MFIVTNRHVDPSKSGPAVLGARPNELGSNELRVVEAQRRGRGWSLNVLPDEMTQAQKRELGMESIEEPLYASTYASRKVLQDARKTGRNILVFVHGFNTALVAADTNNADHRAWVDRLRVREAIYIVINERDQALRASEVKIGDAQQARLGRTRRNLDSVQGIYVDVTDAPSVGRSHAYFEGSPAAPRSILRSFFHKILNGERGEETLPFDPGTRAYKIGGRRNR